mmetsp:Transcript_34406/g.97019  ORF Transcript_34406/g.97019 Transcript_34406/m.97019 type:complete len:204 (-) Transcript_34406:29-640(-)
MDQQDNVLLRELLGHGSWCNGVDRHQASLDLPSHQAVPRVEAKAFASHLELERAEFGSLEHDVRSHFGLAEGLDYVVLHAQGIAQNLAPLPVQRQHGIGIPFAQPPGALQDGHEAEARGFVARPGALLQLLGDECTLLALPTRKPYVAYCSLSSGERAAPEPRLCTCTACAFLQFVHHRAQRDKSEVLQSNLGQTQELPGSSL